MPPESTPYSRGIWPRLCVRDFARRTLAALQGTRLRPGGPCDCGLTDHAIAAWRGTRLRPGGPCAPGVASRAPAVSHPRLRGVANRPRAPSAARTHRQCLSTARSTAPATGASTRQTPSGGFAFLRRRPLEGRKRTVGVVGRGGGVAAGPSRAASAPRNNMRSRSFGPVSKATAHPVLQ